jgi:serine/threonine-protein kinase mTOR
LGCRQLVEEYDDRRSESLREFHAVVECIVGQLLTMAASDMDASVRRAVVESFLPTFEEEGCDGKSLQTIFAQADSASALTVCLNDVSQHVRLASLTIMGKIAQFNPAAASPVLRRHLQQLLADFESSPDSARLDATTVLLSKMIELCSELVMPNLEMIQGTLAKKLQDAWERVRQRDGRSKSGHSMTDSIMQVISVLVSKVSVHFRPYVKEVLSNVILAITDKWNDAKHLPSSVHCLGRICGCSGYVTEPYIDEASLLPALLSLLDQTYSATLHVKVVEVLGIIGALGPHTHKLIQACFPAHPVDTT